MGIQKEEAEKRAKEENGSTKMDKKVKAMQITVLVCPCGSRNVYRTKTELICRKCGRREKL